MLAVWENVLFFEPPTRVHEDTHTDAHTHAHTQFIHKVKMGVHVLQMQKAWIIHTGRRQLPAYSWFLANLHTLLLQDSVLFF